MSRRNYSPNCITYTSDAGSPRYLLAITRPDSDIMVEAPAQRLLFTGDIVEHGRAVSSDVPQDFNAKGQIEAIRYALELPVDTFVPGHGVMGGREIPQAALDFSKSSTAA